jgi:hypothetical protein
MERDALLCEKPVMPKGEGSSRIEFFSSNALEERTLLSHSALSSTVHTTSVSPPSQVAPLATTAKTDVDSTHSASDNPGDVQERDSEQVAAATQAASSVSKDQYTFPLVFNSLLGRDPGEASPNSMSFLATNRSLANNSTEEHIAWRVGISTSLNVVTMARDWSELTPEVPETLLSQSDKIDGETRSIAETRTDVQEVLGDLTSRGADLLAPYLPFDRTDLEQAIDRVIDGIEVLGDTITQTGETAELIPMPIAWGIGLVTVEMIRRRLRDDPEGEGSVGPDQDPALGLRGFPS